MLSTNDICSIIFLVIVILLVAAYKMGIVNKRMAEEDEDSHWL